MTEDMSNKPPGNHDWHNNNGTWTCKICKIITVKIKIASKVNKPNNTFDNWVWIDSQKEEYIRIDIPSSCAEYKMIEALE